MLGARQLVVRTLPVARRCPSIAQSWVRSYSAETPKAKDTGSSPSDDKAASKTPAHSFDLNKPRKPLSRVAIGGSDEIRVRKGLNTQTPRSIWLGAALFLGLGGAALWFFRREKQRLKVREAERQHRGIGKAQIGGPFNLIDQDGNKFTHNDLLGKFSIVYFGFTKCPDICPEELEVLAEVLKVTNKDEKRIQPIFVTCDPARDTPEILKEYLAEFHPDIIGLTGEYEEIKNICKNYRVYFSTPPNLKPGQDYLVDHSIFFYIMDPEGHYIDVMGRNYDGKQATEKVLEHLDAWRPENEDTRSWIQKLF